MNIIIRKGAENYTLEVQWLFAPNIEDRQVLVLKNLNSLGKESIELTLPASVDYYRYGVYTLDNLFVESLESGNYLYSIYNESELSCSHSCLLATGTLTVEDCEIKDELVSIDSDSKFIVLE